MDSKSVNEKDWEGLDIYSQMGNIYSEVGRSIKYKKNGKEIEFDRALGRALELFQLTINYLIRKKSPKAKEVLRAREEYLSVLFDQSFPDEDMINPLENYFYQFALAARKDR